MSKFARNQEGGFTIHRRVPTTAERVYAAFVEPAKLEQWFVVPGYHTPADRIRVDARPGGRVDAVMVADLDGTEIPFTFTCGDLVPEHLITLHFDQPHEVVTVILVDDGADEVDLTYTLTSWSAPKDEATSRRGVEDMLDRIEDGVRRGIV
ncbi:MAG: SRPBCC domain-containing protein [Thermomicrobiales bacterium]